MGDILDGLGIKAGNYKCFGEEPQGFDTIKRVNLVVGRNNAGKSALLDVIQQAISSEPSQAQDYQRVGSHRPPELQISRQFTQTELAKTSPKFAGVVSDHLKPWLERPLVLTLAQGTIEKSTVVGWPGCRDATRQFGNQIRDYLGKVLGGTVFHRLRADRQIGPEGRSPDGTIDERGKGATNAISKCHQDANAPLALVTGTLREAINAVCEPDCRFTDIVPRQHVDGKERSKWEVFLSRDGVSSVPLTHSGCGLHTIALVMANIHLRPFLEHHPIGGYWFGFEELENSLHPSLQRRLFGYLLDFARKNGCVFFITTHSSIPIDVLSREDDVQILHVAHDGDSARVTTVEGRRPCWRLLGDLGVRPSDVLQSNAVVWVEGPSDRIYFNRWIELWSDGQLREGTHYVCLFYGGSGLLVHHFGSDTGQDSDDLALLLQATPYAILICDSDKTSEDAPVDERKREAVKQVDGAGGLGWITAGYEVENYLPPEALQARLRKADLRPMGQYERFEDYHKDAVGKGVRTVRFAKTTVEHLTRERLEGTLDLADRLDKVIAKLREWNGICVDHAAGDARLRGTRLDP